MLEFFSGLLTDVRALLIIALSVAGLIVGLKVVYRSDDRQQDYSRTALIGFNVIIGAIIAGASVAGGLWLLGNSLASDITSLGAATFGAVTT